MISGIQLVIIAFAACMIYISYASFRRKQIGINDVILWTIAWIALFFAALFPSSISKIVQTLNIERGFDFFTIAGFIFILIIVFSLFKTVRKMQKNIEIIVNNLAKRK